MQESSQRPLRMLLNHRLKMFIVYYDLTNNLLNKTGHFEHMLFWQQHQENICINPPTGISGETESCWIRLQSKFHEG